MHFKKIYPIFFILIIAQIYIVHNPTFVYAGHVHTMTLEEAMEVAINQNPLIEKAQEALAKARLDISFARSVIRPAIGMEIGRSYNHNYSAYGLTDLLIGQSPDQYVASEITTNELSIYLAQPLYTQGKYGLQKEIVEIGTMIAHYNLDLMKQDVVLEVIKAYLEILKAQEIINIREQARDRLLEYLQSTKVKYEVGLVAQNIVIGAEMELSGAESDLIEAEANYKIRKENLKRTLQFSMEDDIEVKRLNIGENISFISETEKSKEQLIDYALQHRLDYLSLLQRIALSEKNVKLAYSDFLPTVNLEAAYIKEGEEFLPKEELYSIGATISLPFFEKGLRLYRVREKKNEARQLESERKSLEQMIRFEVVNAFFSLNSLLSRVKATEKQVEFATENMRITKLQFNEGAASNLDVLDAHLKLVEAATSRTTREYDLIIAQYTLKKAIGDLKVDPPHFP
ncbi:MAG: TolC family protein [bacterium]